MSYKAYLLLFFLSLAVLLISAAFQPVPGFMDAEYYFAGGLQLAQGKGFTESYLWNYLDDPTGLPHASHAYWMPLASLVTAVGIFITGSLQFSAARIGFILLATSISPLTAALSYRLIAKKHWALLAGFLAIFSGFYLPYLTTTDTFAIYMFLGAVYFLMVPKAGPNNKPLRWIILGVITGVMHLSRADGILWVPVTILIIFLLDDGNIPRNIKNSIYVIAGYLLIMGPWMLRNLTVLGTPMTPGGLQSMWITEYDALFSYPASRLTFEHWWASGFLEILQARAWALGINLQRILGEQGLIFLTPLIIIGLWRTRKDLRVVAGLWVWILAFCLMTIIFPFAGARGGLFHACAALQPLFWAVAPIGLGVCLDWTAHERNWNIQRSGRVFGIALVGIAALFSVAVYFQTVFGSDHSQPIWTLNQRKYSIIEEELLTLGASQDDIVMVKNSPGYYLISNRPGIAIPFGGENTLVEAAARYGARYIILEFDHPKELTYLYQNPEDHPPELEYLLSLDGTHIFRVK